MTWSVRSRIGELGKVITGRTPPSSRPECFGQDFPFITPSDMDGRKTINSTDRYLSNAGHSLLRLNLLPPGSVAVSCIGWQMGKSALTSRPSFTNQQLNSIIPHLDRVHPDYLFYVLTTRREDLKRLGSVGTRTPILNKRAFCAIELQLPDLKTQRQIASILSAYDDLIENNTRRIKILEEMAQMIYREWFVNFRFPGHENVRMVDSELGPIPEGWRAGVLEDAFALQRGFDLPASQRGSGSVPIIAATGLNGSHNIAKVKGPGVVTGRSGSLGSVMLVWEDFWPLNTTLWVKEFRQSNALHAYFTLKDLALKGFNSGAAVPTLNRNDIHGLPMVIPNSGILNALHNGLVPLFMLKANLEAKNRNLRTTRDFLLPKLISGEVPVEAAEDTAAEFLEQTA